MSFLDEFDKRADAQKAGRKPDDPVPPGETPENRELLDFADLIRKNQAAPSEIDRQRVMEKLNQNRDRQGAEEKTRGRGDGETGGQNAPQLNFRTPHVALWFAVAALLALAIGLGVAYKNIVPRGTGTPGKIAIDTKDGPKLVKASAAPVSDKEFADLNFPTPKLAEGAGAAVETATGKDTARLTRVHGLVLLQSKGEKRWRVCQRGQALQLGDTIRTSKRLDSSARILAPDGSAVSVGAGSAVTYGENRGPFGDSKHPMFWHLAEGNVYFDFTGTQMPVLNRSPDAPFARPVSTTVTLPQGQLNAFGSRFLGTVGPKQSICYVDQGDIGARPWDVAARALVRAGASAVLTEKEVISNADKGSLDWLKVLDAELASDYGIGELVAKAEKANEHLPLEIKSHSVTVTVVDQVARTFVDEIFINNSDRRLEGTFYYPLPPDASISEFAMYVGEQRILGEVLEQQRARQIFEYIVRQQKDPALLEYAGGNLFKMRVFPIEPHSEKRVQLGYTQILPRSSGTVTYTYPLYSEKLIKNPLHDLRIEFRVISSPGLSELQSPTHQAPTAIGEDGKRGALAFRARNYSPTRDFSVTYKVPDGAECIAFAHKRPDDSADSALSTQHSALSVGASALSTQDSALQYFMLQLCPKAGLPRRDPPERLLVIVDGSASATAQEYAIATEFAASAADVSGNWQFGVLRGGQKPQVLSAIGLSDGDTSSKVRDALQKSQPLGATDLLETFRAAAEVGRASLPANTAEGGQGRPPHHIVYVGDGIDTVSELSGPALVKEIAALFKGTSVKVSTVAVGSSYDRPVLQGLAAKLGGTFTHVDGAADVHAAVGQVFESFYRPMLWDVMCSFEGVAVSHVYPEFIGTLADGDTAIVLGRCKPGRGQVKLLADLGDKLAERVYPLDLHGDEATNRFLPRLWAKAHIDAQLATMGLGTPADDARTRQSVIQTSIGYQIMSPYTAFLVLESEEDYARFGIKRTLKQWDWNGDAKGLNVHNGIQPEGRELAKLIMPSSGTVLRAEPLSLEVDRLSESLSKTVGETVLSEELLERAELGDHFETINPDRPDTESSFGNADAHFFFAEEKQQAQQDADDGSLIAFDAEDEYAGRRMHWARSDDLALIDKYFVGEEEKSLEWGAGVKFKQVWYDEVFTSPVLHQGLTRSYLRGFQRGGSSYYRQSYPRQRANYASSVLQPNRLPALEVDQPLKATAAYQRIMASGKGTDSTRLNLALALEADGEYQKALAAFSPLLEKFPTLSELKVQEGQLRCQTSDIAVAKAAFAKALELAPEKERRELQERVANLLSTAGQNAEAATRFLDLAKTAETPADSVRLAQQAASNFLNAVNRGAEAAAQSKKAAQVWDEVLARWKDNADMQLAAGQWWLNYGDGQRGVDTLTALAAGLPKAGVSLTAYYAQHKQPQKALAEARRVFEKATDANDVFSALVSIDSSGRGASRQEALALLGEGHSAAQISGAVQYLQSYYYYALRSRPVVETLLSATQRKDFPAQARLNAFNALRNSQNYVRNLKVDFVALLAPLCENPATDEEWSRAIQAIQTLSNYGQQKDALQLIQKLSGRMREKEKDVLALAEIVSLLALDRMPEAEQRTLAALTSAADEQLIWQSFSRMFSALLAKDKIDSATRMTEAYAARFPDSPLRRTLYQSLLQRAGRDKKDAEAAALLDKLLAAHSADAALLDLKARSLAKTGEFQAAAARARQAIGELSKPVTLPEDQFARTKYTEAMAKAEAEKRARLQAQRDTARREVISLLAQLSAQTADLREPFIKEAETNAKNEDPIAREWTEAALACENAAGLTDAALKRLQALASAEPNDPLWPRRLAQALISAHNYADARKVLAPLAAAEPNDAGLAMTLRDLCEQLKDTQAAETCLMRSLEAWARNPSELAQQAYNWQRGRPEWALRAWKILEQKPGYAGQAPYQAAQIQQQLGRQKEAAELFFKVIAGGDQSYASSALNSLTSICQQEEHLRAILPQVYKALDDQNRDRKGAAPGSPLPREGEGLGVRGQQLYLHLLAYHLEKQKGATDAARKELDAAIALDLPSNDYNAGTAVVNALLEAGRLDAVCDYATKGGGNLSPDSRRYLMRHAASSLESRNRALSIKLRRRLAEDSDQNSNEDHKRLAELLSDDGQFDAAKAALEKIDYYGDAWSLYYAYDHVITAYVNKKNFEQAALLALQGWDRLNDEQQSGYNAQNWLVRIARDGFSQLSAETRKTVTARIQQWLREYFSGDPQQLSWIGDHDAVLKNMGLEEEAVALAKAAAESNDGRRVACAANFNWAHLQNGAEAKRLYQRALTLNDVDENAVAQEFFRLLSDSRRIKADWSDALEVLEKLKALKAYDEPTYLRERARCLYAGNRTDEAREALRKVLGRREVMRRGYWELHNIADLARTASDWTLSAEVWEKAISALRRTSRQIDPGTAGQAYGACAEAYAKAGQKDKALDCYLRGMSVVPRNTDQYKELTKQALKSALKGEALDKAAAEYEKDAASNGNERPHLRLAFAEGYRQAGNTAQVLHHLRIAANLLPKDTELRQQVIDGYKKASDTEAALGAYAEWAKFDPQNIEIYRGLGDFYESLGRREDALLAWATMAEIRPREAEGYRAYAQKLVSIGKHDAAAVALRHAIKYRPTEFAIVKELADAYEKLNQKEKAAELWTAGETACRKATEDFADDPQPWLDLGQFLKAQGRAADAEDHYRKILARSWPRFQRETYDEANKRLKEK
ncbi:MAG TPA: VIT domain-containing protein [Planctomycetota bacterium]|jgi:tetratricopeptide (TPR) repeat protein